MHIENEFLQTEIKVTIKKKWYGKNKNRRIYIY